MSMKERYLELKVKLDELKEKITKEYQSAFCEICKELFDNNPTIEAFRWNQYTPYFNDGESCEFGVNSPFIKIVGLELSEDDDEYGDSFFCEYFFDKKYRKEYKAVEELTKTFEGSFRDMFGDGVTVTVNREGVETEEYTDHE